MGAYKGNRGHLMQHWTLCELLVSAGKHSSGLSFIDAHAMAPLATENRRKDTEFVRIQDGLPGRGSVYEQAWHNLDPNEEGYPNSAAFVTKVWDGDFSLLLCETDHSTIAELKPWLERVETLARCKSAKLFQDDWRMRFDEGLPSASEVGLANGSLTLVSFDPYKYDKRRGVVGSNQGDLYPGDIERALDAMSSLKGGILIQLSTYSTRGNNSQGSVISSVNSILEPSAFTLCAVAPVNKKMMSLVYARNVPWSAELANLPDRFKKWLSGC